MNTDLNTKIAENFDWQGHRGARGLLPENTIEGFLKALEYPVTTLELDLAVSKNLDLIVSHEPWMNPDICTLNGQPFSSENQEHPYPIFAMTTAEIQAFDCGSLGNPRFTQQEMISTKKPTLAEVVAAVKVFCAENDRAMPAFNIEIKSQPEYDFKLTPPVHVFAGIVVTQLKALEIKSISTIQSFDPRALNKIHEIDGSIQTALLVENQKSIEENLSNLNYKPEIYSPFYKLLNKDAVAFLHQENIQVIPWTVNNSKDAQNLINLGVDGIITDFPDMIE